MSAMEKSDLREVARKRANKAVSTAGEPVERRGGTTENADDFIVGFEHRHEAEQFLADLKARLARFGLNLHPDKTRLIEFGRSAIANRHARGLGKPETFHFLGFTHYCATRRDGSGFVLGRKPMAKRMRTKLREIKEKLMATRHDGIDGQGQWLAQVLRGWMAYYAVPMSGSALSAFRHHMIERWHGALMRRSQRRRLTWRRMKTIADRYLPFPRILHPWPEPDGRNQTGRRAHLARLLHALRSGILRR